MAVTSFGGRLEDLTEDMVVTVDIFDKKTKQHITFRLPKGNKLLMLRVLDAVTYILPEHITVTYMGHQ